MRKPPPATTAAPASGQWSRPSPREIRGARPNSPHITTATSFSRPRSCRSVTRAWKPLVELRQLVPHVDEVLLVRVPVADLERHDRHARLDQPAGHQELLAELAVAVARRRRLPLQVERLAQPSAT